MKKTIIILLCVLFVTLPIALNSLQPTLKNTVKIEKNTGFWANFLNNYNVIYAVAGAVLTVVAFVIKQYLGFEINNQQLQRIRIWITNLITDAEDEHKNKPGVQRQLIVEKQINDVISKKDRKIISRNFGTISNAVEYAYQKSHLATKHKKSNWYEDLGDFGLNLLKQAGATAVNGVIAKNI